MAFIPRSKCLLISWLQSPFAVILEPKIHLSVVKKIFVGLLTNRMFIVLTGVDWIVMQDL